MALPYHRWPAALTEGDWKRGAIIRCEGEGCPYCRDRWTLVDPATLEDVTADDYDAALAQLRTKADC